MTLASKLVRDDKRHRMVSALLPGGSVMNRFSRFAFAASALGLSTIMGCASASEPDETETTVSSTEALTDCNSDLDQNLDCDGTGKQIVTLIGISGTTLTARRSNGQILTTALTSTTKYRLANLNRFYPVDPIFPALQAYNSSVQTGTEVVGTVSGLVTFSAHVRITLTNTNTVRAFRPVP
jgi:hypothetical protein